MLRPRVFVYSRIFSGLSLIFFLFLSGNLIANDIQVSNVSIASQDVSNDYRMVEFDISWDNSWRTSSYESNRDAAWIFLKWRKKADNVWNHASLYTSGHSAPAGATINTPSDGKGVFMYRSSDGIGNVSWSGAQVKWDYGADGVADDDSVEVCVFAIEMVYVPQGDFYLGDSTTSPDINGQFEKGTDSDPYVMDSENSLTLGGGGSNLGNNNANNMKDDDFDDSKTQTLPSDFPKGHDAFYVMKYEITQEQYVDFLNKLTYSQQNTRTAQSPNSSSGTYALDNSNRNGIQIKSSGVSPSQPAIYACNLDNDGTFDEKNDGQNIACNFLSWGDVAAYLDWAGLRPFTELEYEKACRGDTTIDWVTHEYAWGDTVIQRANDIFNDGEPKEKPSNSTANCNWDNEPDIPGPMRVGCFSGSGTNRHSSGATYFGIMEMSGNLWERPVTVGKSDGRSFTGGHGDGALDPNGDADVSDWPGKNASGIGFRGGAWNYTDDDRFRVSDRNRAGEVDDTRRKSYGGRGGRTAP